MITAATVTEARAPTGKAVLDCAPEVKEKFHFMTLFGLQPDPVLYGRMTEAEGLPTKSLLHFIKNTGLQAEQIVPLLGIVPRTMERRMEAGRLMPEETDKIFQIARAFDVMIDVLGDAHSALVWFKTPQKDLDDHTPLEKCRTESGRNMVNDEVVRIDYNVY
ncbi:MAG: antitoxin Xre/MbcA/ParS toxin-binding domain-containing protein [Anaerolineales bacterium]